MLDESWMDSAACRGLDVEVFYSMAEADNRAAIRVCRQCPVRGECFQAAMNGREAFGVWGGTLETQRRRVFRREQREGRKTAA